MKWLLSKAKIRIRGPVRDTMLEAHLLDENTPDKSLGTLASTHTTLKDHKDGLLNYRKEHGCSHAEVPPEIMIPYGCADVDAAIRLDEVFLPKLKKQGLLPLLKLESRAVKMFVEIENNGFKIDVDRVDELVDHYEGVIAEKEEIVRRIAGEEFNDRSAPQVYKLLYHKWDLPPMGLVKPWEGKTGYDTTEYTLVRLRARHDLSGKQERFLDALLFLRENRKLLSTYIMGMSDYLRTGNFLHPWFRLDGTVTGRLSCTGPNLQQIPREGPIKSLFISRYGKNGLVVQHDLSQAELRFAAHMSGERTLCRMFREGGTDIHLATAAQVLRKPIDQVTPQERKRAKTVNFGILYGTQKWTLAEKMGMTVRAAGRFIEEWKGVFSDWPPYEKAVRKEVLEKGYVVSPFSRRRRLPIIDPSSSQGKEALRQAINSPIQGGVCDLTLHCGWKAWQRVKKEKLDKVHIVAQVHDAWISDCHKSQARAFDEIMKEEFHHSDLSEFGFQMKVPMVLECSAGINWKEVQPW
jgi:DNA polymerase-1